MLNFKVIIMKEIFDTEQPAKVVTATGTIYLYTDEEKTTVTEPVIVGDGTTTTKEVTKYAYNVYRIAADDAKTHPERVNSAVQCFRTPGEEIKILRKTIATLLDKLTTTDSEGNTVKMYDASDFAGFKDYNDTNNNLSNLL